MRHLARSASALALVLSSSIATAQDPRGRSVVAPGGFVPAEAIYCDDGSGHAIVCAFGDGVTAAATGVASTTAKPVQNADGSKLATDAQLVGAVTQLTTATARLSAILTVLGSPAQAPAPAASAPATGSVTATAVTPTSGTGTFAGGTAVIPFAPTLGLPVRVVLRGGAAFSAYVGTSTDSCATINPLTVGGQPWATFTGSADEYVDTPVSTATTSSIKYCLVVTVTSGTETYGVRQ